MNGNDRITCNTGWVEESYDDVITQLMLAETIKLDNQPYNLITDSVKLQQGINDNNINYTLEFRFAADKLNYNV
ncbi:hypothetical protein [Lysinibacillus pakistanensis]|uniref:Uncharacterized protein n=1 Tax=Lysinibacillus pakistanensis TaxID=759811 RepID=A0ABX6DLR4_9BACI|nr:hypothetical protein GDS87_24335 [Lysinibacillus pakistanensis]QGG54104.1 hypothetical protein GDS87_24605 [Lysinibacillus pakistanensis]